MCISQNIDLLWHRGVRSKPAGSRGPTQTSAAVEEDKRDKKRKVKSEAGADTDGKKSKKSKK